MAHEAEDNPIARVDYDEAKMLSDLGAIVQDLDFAMKTCSRLKVLLKENSQDYILIESLWTAALIRYARCSASGKRFGLTETIFEGLQGEAIEVHRFYVDLRNKHVAHSVNPFEQMEVGLMLSPKSSPERKVIGVATLAVRHISPDVEGVHQLGLLSKALLEKTCELGKQYEQKTLEIGMALPIDDLYKRARPRITAPSHESANKPRV